MSRGAVATIDLTALRHNLRQARRTAPNSAVFPAVKANAYGHGLLRVARALSDADGLAVACIEEAVVLREGGIAKPILLLEGVFEASELPVCRQLDLDIAVHQHEQLEMLERAPAGKPLRVWLKIDTAMHRLGITPVQTKAFWRRLRNCPAVSEIRLMSHLAMADTRTDEFTLDQLRLFQDAADTLPGARSLANSAGILGWPQTHFDIVRPGLMLYGASPFAEDTGRDHGLRPAMTLATRLISIKRLHKGDTVGYSRTFVCPEDMDIGIAAIGYGDGYPRQLPNGTRLLVNGREAALVGRVSMDMLSVDLRRHPEARVGDPVTLWGADIPVEAIASAAGTIPYTLLCGVTTRVRFETIDDNG